MEKLLMVLKLLPAIFTAIKAVEEAIPISGAGREKLQLIREIMEGTYSSISDIWPSVEAAISSIVKLFNAKGIFTK